MFGIEKERLIEMSKIYVGIDNGVTGSIGVIYNNSYSFKKLPIKSEQSYTKTKQNITRIEFAEMLAELASIKAESLKKNCGIFCLIERPMVNPGRFKATISALRALESVLICLEKVQISFQYIDSKEWQKVLLPKGIEKEQLKKASCDVACRLFPEFKENIIKHKDGDSLLMAEYARRKGL